MLTFLVALLAAPILFKLALFFGLVAVIAIGVNPAAGAFVGLGMLFLLLRR